MDLNSNKIEEIVKFNMDKNVDMVNKYEGIKQQYHQKLNTIEKEHESLSIELGKMKSDLEQITTKRNIEENRIKGLSLELKDFFDKKQILLKKIGSLGQINSNHIEEMAKRKKELLDKINNDSTIETVNKLEKLLEPFLRKLNKADLKMKDFEKINRFALEDYKKFKEKEN